MATRLSTAVANMIMIGVTTRFVLSRMHSILIVHGNKYSCDTCWNCTKILRNLKLLAQNRPHNGESFEHMRNMEDSKKLNAVRKKTWEWWQDLINSLQCQKKLTRFENLNRIPLIVARTRTLLWCMYKRQQQLACLLEVVSSIRKMHSFRLKNDRK